MNPSSIGSDLIYIKVTVISGLIHEVIAKSMRMSPYDLLPAPRFPLGIEKESSLKRTRKKMAQY